MKWISTIAVIALLLQVGYVPCAALEVSPGTRVRVTAPSIAEHRIVGTIVTIGADTLTLKTKRKVEPFILNSNGQAETLAIPFASVTKLEVIRGKKRNVVKGAGIGVVVGGLSGVVYGFSEGDDPPGGILGWTAKEKAAMLGIMGSLSGGVLGALIGALKTTDRWEKAPLDRLRLGLMPQRQGGLALSTSFSF